jgi:hypothetical protein
MATQGEQKEKTELVATTSVRKELSYPLQRYKHKSLTPLHDLEKEERKAGRLTRGFQTGGRGTDH